MEKKYRPCSASASSEVLSYEGEVDFEAQGGSNGIKASVKKSIEA
jgi:hypothetical protein